MQSNREIPKRVAEHRYASEDDCEGGRDQSPLRSPHQGTLIFFFDNQETLINMLINAPRSFEVVLAHINIKQ